MFALLIGVFVHEIGHAIGAILAKFQIILFVVGPIQIISKVGGGYALRLNQNAAYGAGLVYALPHQFIRLRQRYRLFIGGGLIASLIFGMILAIWAWQIWAGWQTSIPQGISPANFSLWSFGCLIGITGWTSLFLFVCNIVPYHAQTSSSDGLKLFQLRKDNDEARRSTAMLVINCFLMLRQRPSKLPLELIDNTLAISDNSPEEAQARLIAYTRALDTKTMDIAEIHIERLKLLYRGRKVYAASRPILTQWVAYHEAIYKENVSESRRWLDEADRIKFTEATLLYRMSHASVFFLQGKNQQAMKQAEQWAQLWDRERRGGGEVVGFYRDQMEVVTRKYSPIIRASLSDIERS